MPFACDAVFLRGVDLIKLTTNLGEVDVSFVPSGTTGYDELLPGVVEYDLGGLVVPVAGLADIIRSKEAADRPKDRAALPTLRALLERLSK